MIHRFPFLPGVYAIRLGVDVGELTATVFYAENLFFFQVTPDGEARAGSMREGIVAWESEWLATAIEAPQSDPQQTELAGAE
jgi:hypothetical protein